LAAELGDEGWQALLHDHHRVVRQQLERFGGHEVKTVGDGFLVTFDGPARIIRCAGAIRESVRELGLEIRAGIHTGEIEVQPADIAGLAVHIGARISVLARGGEVLVSSTVKDLVVGSGIAFETRGDARSAGASPVKGTCSRQLSERERDRALVVAWSAVRQTRVPGHVGDLGTSLVRLGHGRIR
jgi:class 3 adenylate cyclase